MSAQDDCIFCRIARGEAPCARICEDADTLAFLDLFPASEGHALVIPRAHCADVFEAPPAALRAVAATARRVAVGLRTALAPDGLSLHQLNGRAAGQTVFHYHVHLIPHSGSAGGEPRIHGRRQADPGDLERLARRIAAELPEE